jgi:hypothetical protein
MNKMSKQDDKEITKKNFTTIFLDQSFSRAPDRSLFYKSLKVGWEK